MARRLTWEEKGKNQLAETTEPRINRMKAPYVDNS